jgi:hypothetical protein
MGDELSLAFRKEAISVHASFLEKPDYLRTAPEARALDSPFALV